MTEVRRDSLDHWINRINVPIGRLDGVAREQVENQQLGPLIVIRTIRQLFITLPGHQLVQRGLRWRVAFYERLGSDDDGLAIVGYDAIEPDVIIENLVLKIEPVEIFGRGCSMSKRTQGDAIAHL